MISSRPRSSRRAPSLKRRHVLKDRTCAVLVVLECQCRSACRCEGEHRTSTPRLSSPPPRSVQRNAVASIFMVSISSARARTAGRSASRERSENECLSQLGYRRPTNRRAGSRANTSSRGTRPGTWLDDQLVGRLPAWHYALPFERRSRWTDGLPVGWERRLPRRPTSSVSCCCRNQYAHCRSCP